LFALDDVIDAGNGKAVFIDVPLPCILKPLDAIGSENQVQVEWTVSELNEIFAPANPNRIAPDFPKKRYFTPCR